MRERVRILKKGGVCIIKKAFKEGKIYENEEIQTPEERLAHFGQEDHVRIYSVAGLVERLRGAGFQVAVLEFDQEEEIHGFKAHEVVLKASKI